MPKARIFFIMQYAKHPKTGEELINQEQIEEGLDHKTIKRWAYCLHDKDVWNDDDELEDSSHVSGETKPPHYHIAIELPKNATEISRIAEWFGVPENYIEMKRGRGAFLDCVEYLTHEHPRQQSAGKYRYDDNEIISNFDWRKELDERALSRSKYGTDLTLKERIRLSVLNGEMSLKQVKKEYPINYVSDIAMLEKLRMNYITNANPPRIRHNFYITGGGGVGKGVASICLAHSLYPDIEDEDDLIFTIGSNETSFLGYDGQPVIIWDDCRSYDLIKILGSRGNVFKVFDTTPKKARQHVKYGSVNLINSVNIVNSVQPWVDFLDGLVGQYVDKNGEFHEAEEGEKSQSYRRFPFIVPLRTEDFDILINKGYVEDNATYTEYRKYQNIIGNFGKLAKTLPEMVTTVQVGQKMLSPLLNEVKTVEEKRGCNQQTTANKEDIMDQFKNYGKTKKQVELEKKQAEESFDLENLEF